MKKFLGMLCIVILMFVVTGCGGNNSGSGSVELVENTIISDNIKKAVNVIEEEYKDLPKEDGKWFKVAGVENNYYYHYCYYTTENDMILLNWEILEESSGRRMRNRIITTFKKDGKVEAYGQIYNDVSGNWVIAEDSFSTYSNVDEFIVDFM